METVESEQTNGKIEIVTRNGQTRMIINGTDVSNVVCGLSYSMDAGKTPVLNFQALGLNVSIDTDVMPTLPAPWSTWYEHKKIVPDRIIP